MAFENPFLQPSAVRKSALQYLWSDEPESAIQVTPAPSSSSSFIADLFGVGAASPLTAPAATTAPISSEGGDYVPPVPNNTTIGIGKATDARNQKAMIAAFMGLLTGGLSGAATGAGRKFVEETMKVLNEVNNTDDPLQALNAMQGWTDTREPAPVVSGQTNYNTPYSGMLNEESISLAETPAPAAPQTAFPVTPTPPAQPAVTSPVVGEVGSGTSFQPVDPGIQAAVDAVAQAQAQAEAQAAAQAQAQAQAQAAAEANAAANAAAIAAAQSGDYSSNSGGDLGTGASDAAGFGGYGGVW
jgi:hypothetical protein